MKKKTQQRIFAVAAIMLTVAAMVYLIVTGRHYLTRRNLLAVRRGIEAYGMWSPVLIFCIFMLNVLVPPLPVPILLVEMAAGLIFGFLPGVMLIWLSQVISCTTGFKLTKYLGKKFLGRIANSRWWGFYRDFLKKRGAFGVFVIRATMSSPFNVSYLAGLLQMDTAGFMAATALGVIPEAVIFAFLGNLLAQHIRIRLWYVFIFVVVMSIAPGLVLTSWNFFRSKNITQLSRR